MNKNICDAHHSPPSDVLSAFAKNKEEIRSNKFGGGDRMRLFGQNIYPCKLYNELNKEISYLLVPINSPWLFF